MELQEGCGALSKPITVSVELPEAYAYVGVARRMGRAILEHCQAPAQDVDDTEVVIGELCSNAARHACSESGWYRCTIEHHGDSVVVTVCDQGEGFDPGSVSVVGAVRSQADGSERFGGYGLPLVRGLVDHLHVEQCEPHGTMVRAEKRLLQFKAH